MNRTELIVEKIKSAKVQRRRAVTLWVVLSVFVMLAVAWSLHDIGNTMTIGSLCDKTEHQHSDACFVLCADSPETVLLCSAGQGARGSVAHVHDDFCYDGEGRLICPLEEFRHSHDESCLDEDGVIACGIGFHQHNEDCFGFPNDDQPVRVLVCGTPVHVHDFGCFGATPDKAVIAANYDGEENFGGGSPAIAPFSAGSGESEPVSHVIPFNTEGASNMDDYIQSWGIQYYDKVNDKWITVTNGMNDLPANTNYKINIDFYISQLSTITSKKLVLEEKLPDWIAPKDTTFYFNDERAALLQVENGTLLLTFYDDFFSCHTQELSASFYVFGEADWRKINSQGESVNLKGDVPITLDFEDNLPEKYGKVSLDKAVEDHITVIGGDSYFKYSLTVTSHEDKFDIRNICVTDSFKRNAGYVSYYGVGNVPADLDNSENGANPFELRPEGEPAGSVVLSGSDLKWNIGTLSKGSSRTLTYFVKLDNRYVSGASLGDIRNDADVTSGGLPAVKDEDSAVFSPVANLDVSKRIVYTKIDGTGTGTITYEVSVTAWANNSYTLQNVVVKDHFDQKYKNYINKDISDLPMTVTVRHKDGSTETKDATAGYSDAQFDYTISEMKPGDTVTLRYTVRLDNLCTAENSNVKLRNDSDVYIKGLNAQLPKDPVKKAFAEHTVEQHSWIRKMYGDEVKSAKTVGIDGTVLNYGGGTYSDPPATFDVPVGSRMYQVIINEGGDWDLSSATLADQFQPVRDSGGHDNYYMTYTGFLCIEEFDLSDADKSAIATMDNSAAASRLNVIEPVRTIWVDINSCDHDFSITPRVYGLDSGKHTYMFTYYAMPQNMGDVGSIDITNSFMVYGNVGNDTGYVTVPGIMCAVRNTVQGSVFYNYTKYPWYFTSDPGEGGAVDVLDGYYTFKPKEYTGALYWIIKLDGTIKEGLRVTDQLLKEDADDTWGFESMADQKFMDDSVVGVYKGAKFADIPNDFSSFAQLRDGYSPDFDKLDGNERNLGLAYDNTNDSYLYRAVSLDEDLDGRSFAIVNYYNAQAVGDMGYDRKNNGLAKDNSKGINISSKTATQELLLWTFEKESGTSNRYAIKHDGKYLNIFPNELTTSDDPQYFVFTEKSNNPVKILVTNSNNNYFINGKTGMFTVYNQKVGDNDYMEFWEPINSGRDYQWTFKGALNPLSVTFKHDIALEDDEAVYIVLRTAAWSQLKDVNESKRYRNKVTVKNVKTNVENSSMVIAEYVRHTANKVLKLGKAAYSFDALESEDKKWSVAYVGGDTSRLTKWGEDTNVVIRENGLDLTVKEYLEGLGSGTYAEWYVAANWDGSLSGDVDIIDDLPENFEPVCVVLDDWENAVTSPAFPTIPELDSSSSWELRSHELSVKHGSVKSPQTINYYYDESANKLKWRITGLVAENYDARKNETQNKDHSLGFMVICKVRDPDVILNGTATAVENAVTIVSDGVSDRDSDVIVIKGGTSLKKYFGLGERVFEDANHANTFEIKSAKIPFIIDVNPDGETLSSTGTLPPLIDVLSENLDFIASSVTFKYANGSPVPGCSCSVNGQRVTFTGLPDSVKIRIRYEAKINSFTTLKHSDTITNRAYWDGYAPPENAQIDNTTMNFTASGSINLTDHPTLKVIKTEKGNDAKFLSGAEFKLMDSTQNELAVMTTGADGTAEFFMNGSTYLLNYDTVYYIQEIKAPSGYNIDEEEKCFVILKERSADDFSDYSNAFFWDAKIYGDVCEFKAVNEKIVISVSKSFEDVDGQTVQPAAGTYSFGIFADINPLENPNVSPAQVLSITYSDGGDPVYRLGGSVVVKPEFTCAEVGHPYYVFELDHNGKPIAEGKINCSDGGAFETHYTVKGSTSNYVSLSTDYQKINIVNKMASFTLPESGGNGRFGGVFTGIGLIGISVFMLKKRRRF